MSIFYSIIILTLITLCASLRISKETIILKRNDTTFIRGVAILFIMFQHIVQHTCLSDNRLNKLEFIGYLCVGIFFFFSGYGNYYSFQNNKQNAEKWTIKRIARLYITFLCVWILSLILVYFTNHKNYNITDIVKQGITMTLPYWTNWYLKMQALAYVLFYISFKFIKRKNPLVLLVFTIISALVLISMRFESFWWNTIVCFGVGSISAEYKNIILRLLEKINKYIILIISLMISVLIFKLAVSNPYLTPLSSVAFCIFIIVSTYCFNFKSKIISFIGEISLELYLWHLVLLKLVFKDVLNINLSVILFFSLSILLAYGTNKIVSKISY